MPSKKLCTMNYVLKSGMKSEKTSDVHQTKSGPIDKTYICSL